MFVATRGNVGISDTTSWGMDWVSQAPKTDLYVHRVEVTAINVDTDCTLTIDLLDNVVFSLNRKSRSFVPAKVSGWELRRFSMSGMDKSESFYGEYMIPNGVPLYIDYPQPIQIRKEESKSFVLLPFSSSPGSALLSVNVYFDQG